MDSRLAPVGFTLLLFLAFAFAAVSLPGCAGGPEAQSTGEFIDARVISTRVKTRLLQDENVSGFDIKVDTYKDTVQLSGFVENAEQRQRAEEIAKGVPGVGKVINNITVKGQT